MEPKSKGPDPRFIGALSGKFVLPDRGANGKQPPVQVGRLQSISPHEIAMEAVIPPRSGERISAVFEQIGRIDGKVARNGLGGFIVTIIADDKRRDELARTIEWLKKKHAKLVLEQREDPRLVTGALTCRITLSGGSLKCKLVDISPSGAGLHCADEPPAIGDAIKVGEISGKVARHTRAGFGVEFDEHQDLAQLLGKLTADVD